MANVRAARSGLWRDTNPATSPWGWGGTLYPPATGDDVWTNGFIIDVDQPATCASVQNSSATSRLWADGATTTAAAGGRINLGSTTLTAEINPTRAITTQFLIEVSAGATAAIVGSINGGSGGTASVVNVPYGSTLSITGIVSPQTNTSNGCVIVEGTLTATGGVVVVSGTHNASGIYINGTGVVYVIGDLVGSTTNTSTTKGAIHNNGTYLNVTGNVTGNMGTGILVSSSGSTYISGQVTNNSANGSLTSGPGIISTGSGIIEVIGDVSASISTCGIISSSASADVRVSGSLYGSENGFSAVSSPKLRINPTPSNAVIRHAKDGVSTFSTFYTADYSAFNMPQPANVRHGTSYASGQLTGTCHVPSASSVAAGVPVDNTVGTAVLTPAAVQAIVGAAVAGAVTND